MSGEVAGCMPAQAVKVPPIKTAITAKGIRVIMREITPSGFFPGYQLV
jgi:hypothetical protein